MAFSDLPFNPPPLKKQTNTNLLSGSFYQVDFIEYPEIQRNEQLV